MPIQIFDLEFDDWNETEIARHGVRAREIRQVLDNVPIFVRNKKRHPAPIVMIGPTDGGRMLTVPLGKTGRPEVWRPATAWDSSKHERALYTAARNVHGTTQRAGCNDASYLNHPSEGDNDGPGEH